jgi:hypothetical protein
MIMTPRKGKVVSEGIMGNAVKWWWLRKKMPPLRYREP